MNLDPKILEPEPSFTHKNMKTMETNRLCFKRFENYLVAAKINNYEPDFVKNLETGELFLVEDYNVKTCQELLDIAKSNSKEKPNN